MAGARPPSQRSRRARSRRVRAALAGVLAASLWAAAAPAAPPEGHTRILGGRWFHAPVADDDCSVCHTIHRDPVGPNLQAAIPELCYQCHEDVAAQDVVHEPVGKGRCTDCHRVHTSDERPLLIRRIPELCIDCHPVDDKHVRYNTLCTSCHGVHSSATARFLKGERTRNCGRCHADKRRGASVHAPAEAGKCLTCHFTHPDPRFREQYFRARYPGQAYASYGADTFELCDRCHAAALHGEADYTQTGFRAGSVNLHQRHVKGERALSCSVCHDLHATSAAALVVTRVRLPGKDPQPLHFLRFNGGGTCGPVCHDTATYVQAGDAHLETEETP